MIEIPELDATAIRRAAAEIDPVFTRSPAVRPRGLERAARRPGHRQGRDRQPDPLVQGPRDLGRRSTAWRGRAGSARIGRSSCASAGNFGQGVAYAARALGVPRRRVRLDAREPRQGRADAGARRGRSSRSARTSTRPGQRRRRYAARARRRAPRRRRRPADLDRRRDAGPRADRRGRRRPSAGAGGRRGAGRQRRADQRRRVVAAPRRRRARASSASRPRRAPAMTLSLRAGRPIDTPSAADVRRRHRVARRDPARRGADARPGRRDAHRERGGASRGPGGADRRARRHGRGRGRRVVGGSPGRSADPTAPRS